MCFFLDSDTANTNIGCPSKFTEELHWRASLKSCLEMRIAHTVILMSPSEWLIRPHVGRLRKLLVDTDRSGLKGRQVWPDASVGMLELIHWLIDSLISWFIDSLVYWLAGSLILWFISSLCFFDSSIYWPIDYIDSQNHWFIASSTHEFTDSLVHWFIRSVAHGFFHVFDSSLFLHLKKKKL